MSETNRAHIDRAWAAAPVVFSAAVFIVLMCACSKTGGSRLFLNVHSWAIMKYAPTYEFSLLHILVITNLSLTVATAIVYIHEIRRSIGDGTSARVAKMFQTAQNFAWLSILLCVVWGLTYVFVGFLSSLDIDAAPYVASLTGGSDFFVFFIFFGFACSDWVLAKAYRLDQVRCESDEELGERRDECVERQKFARDSLLLVDLPVLLISAILIFFLFLAFQDERFTGLGHEATKIFSRSQFGTGQGQDVQVVVIATFTGGFSLGSAITQLAYSQVVFTILNFRVAGALPKNDGSAVPQR